MISTEGKTIAVVGATGRQGGQVVRHLLKQGWRVRALTRKPEGKRAAELRSLGAEIVQANLEDKASLEAAFENAYGVYDIQIPVSGKVDVEIQQGRNAAEAAKKAGVKHVVYGSAGLGRNVRTGIEQWDAKEEITNILNALGLPLTRLRPMAFMELMTDPSYYPSGSTWHVWPKLSGMNRPIGWISVQDVGAIAAKAFADPEEYVGKDLPLSADVQSLWECREIYREVTGKYPSRFPMPIFLFEKFVGKDLANMWRWLRTNHVDLDTSQTLAIHPEAMTVRTWLQAPSQPASGSTRKS
ncbi:MAG TPA: NmrA/HSCARG family protein [Anaerolineales bacterium]|nr:NmrA/HSCARG family protein [Anaerolineales bacterium]